MRRLRGLGALTGSLVCMLLLASRPAMAQTAPRQSADATLKQAIRLLAELEDEQAKALLLKLLRHSPRAPIAARCHLYLGIIALNALDSDAASTEFKKAIRLDATVELPITASPKQRMLFAEAQGDVAQGAPPPTEAPPPVLYVPPSGSREPPPPSQQVTAPVEQRPANHLPAYVVGGVAVAALAGGVIFGVLSNSTLSQAQKNPVATQAEAEGQQVGTYGLIADICYGTSLVTAAVAVALYFTEKPTDAPAGAVAPSASLVPVPGGLVVAAGGRF